MCLCKHLGKKGVVEMCEVVNLARYRERKQPPAKQEDKLIDELEDFHYKAVDMLKTGDLAGYYYMIETIVNVSTELVENRIKEKDAH